MPKVKVTYTHKGVTNEGGGDLHITTVQMDDHDWNFPGHVEQAVAEQKGTSYFNITAKSWKKV